VIADLEYAAKNLPVNYSSNAIYATNDVGRATKGSALALLCKLYLREKQWQKIVEVTQQIMDLKQYALYPTYSGLFEENNKWCSENIFSALSNNLVDGTEMMNHFGPLNNKEVTDRWQYFAITWYFWNTFEKNDERREMFFYDYIGADGLHYVQPPAGQVNPPAGYYYLPNVASKKYADPKGSTTYLDGHVFPIIRYADILMSRRRGLERIDRTQCRKHSAGQSDKGAFESDVAWCGRHIYERRVARSDPDRTWLGILLRMQTSRRFDPHGKISIRCEQLSHQNRQGSTH
jgi:hypothetical protein